MWRARLPGPSPATAARVHGRASILIHTLRRTSECDAAAIVREHLPALLEHAEEHSGPLLAFVEGEL